MEKTIKTLILLTLLLLISSPTLAITDTFTNSEDSYVRQTSPTKKFGSATTLIADGVNQDPDNGKFGEVATLIQWDVSSIPTTAFVSAASLTLKFTNSSSGVYSIFSQLKSWVDLDVDWNDLSTSVTPNSQIPSNAFGVVTINLGTAMVQGWVNGSIPNNGIAIRSSGTNDGIGMFSADGEFPPTLEVTYSDSGGPTLESLQAEIAQLKALLAGVSRNGDTLVFEQMNLQILNGLGATNGNRNDPDSDAVTSVNGLGNLIVGYDEETDPHNSNFQIFESDKSGSHNIIVGHGHNYSSFGGLVTGQDNAITGQYSNVSGGVGNLSSGRWSSVSGGNKNTASGREASVSGGGIGTASGNSSSVTGGANNTASEYNSSVTGGFINHASGKVSSINGGRENTASGSHSHIGGGSNNTANGKNSSLSGGKNRSAIGEDDWVAGSLFEEQ